MRMSVPRFWREIPNRYRLVGSKCRICRASYFPPRLVCPKCQESHHKGKPVMEKITFSGRGKVASFTRIKVGLSDFKSETPYTMAIIKLKEGPSLTSQIIDCKPKNVRIGMDVEAVFRKIREDGKDGIIHYGYKFRPAK